MFALAHRPAPKEGSAVKSDSFWRAVPDSEATSSLGPSLDDGLPRSPSCPPPTAATGPVMQCKFKVSYKLRGEYTRFRDLKDLDPARLEMLVENSDYFHFERESEKEAAIDEARDILNEKAKASRRGGDFGRFLRDTGRHVAYYRPPPDVASILASPAPSHLLSSPLPGLQQSLASVSVSSPLLDLDELDPGDVVSLLESPPTSSVDAELLRDAPVLATPLASPRRAAPAPSATVTPSPAPVGVSLTPPSRKTGRAARDSDSEDELDLDADLDLEVLRRRRLQELAHKRLTDIPGYALPRTPIPLDKTPPATVHTPGGGSAHLTSVFGPRREGRQHGLYLWARDAPEYASPYRPRTPDASVPIDKLDPPADSQKEVEAEVDLRRLNKWAGKRKGWRPDQKTAMGGLSARQAAAAAGFRDGDWEWLHLIAFSMGGADNEQPNTPENLVAGTKESNSQHLALENEVKKAILEDEADRVEIKATAYLYEDDDRNLHHLAQRMNYDLTFKKGRDQDEMDFTIDTLGSNKPMRGQGKALRILRNLTLDNLSENEDE